MPNRAKEKEPKPTLRDWLIVAATLLAAAAAGGSFWTAVRQERATFTTNLYTKELDAFANLRAEANKFELMANGISVYVHDLQSIKPDASYAADDTKLYINLLREQLDKRDQVFALTQAIYTVQLVSPAEVSDRLDVLEAQVDPIRNAMFELGNNLERITSYPQNTAALTNEITNGMRKFRSINDSIFECSRIFLRLGEFVPNNVMSKCPKDRQ